MMYCKCHIWIKDPRTILAWHLRFLLPSDNSNLNDYWISVDNIEVSEGYVYIYANGFRYDTEFIPKFADPIDSYKLHIWIDVGAEDQMPGCIDLVAYDIVRCM